jgi:hypothetical protein
MIPRALVPSTMVDLYFRRHFSSFASRCETDPSIMPELGEPFNIRYLSEKAHMELADALLENNSVTYLKLEVTEYTASSAKAMAKYLRTCCVLIIRLPINQSRVSMAVAFLHWEND